MLHRMTRSAVIVLSVLGISSSGSFGPALVSTAQADGLSLRFDEIEVFASTESPRARILAQGLTVTEAERDDALQWSNPVIAYDIEEYKPFTEWQVTLGKRFVKPFSQSDLRGGWEDRILAEGLRIEQESSAFLAELKSGYVQLQLLDTYIVRLEELSGLVESAAASAEHRHLEGEISGVGSQLIRLSAFSVQATLRGVRQERGEQAAIWRSQMGVVPGATLDLTTSIRYEPVDLSTVSEYAASFELQPGIQSREAMVESWSKRSSAARPDLIPAFDVYGGFKRFEPDFDGFVAGISLDLPLFDRKAGASRNYDAARAVAENELTIALTRGTEEIAALVTAIQDAQPSLGGFAEELDQLAPLTEALLLSYREGSLSLDALLNAILIESNAVERYYLELATYYRNIFRLEALTGVELVGLAP